MEELEQINEKSLVFNMYGKPCASDDGVGPDHEH
jgi:hypothetical protein